MTEQECRALFFREMYVLASSEPDLYRGFKAGMMIEREACIEAARTVGGDAGAEVEKLIRARGQP